MAVCPRDVTTENMVLGHSSRVSLMLPFVSLTLVLMTLGAGAPHLEMV